MNPTKATAQKQAELEVKIKREYTKAAREARQRATEYFDTLEERFQQEFEKYQQGVYTTTEFNAWYITQVRRGEGYQKMADDLANRAVKANMVASAYINDATPSIYALNYNYSAYEISQAYGEEYANVSFQLYDEQTVKGLIKGDNHVEFRTTRINPVRDYAWNRELINSALTAGIMQGKPINKLADSFMDVMGRNRTSALRNARTAVTSAQNGGRLESYRRANEMGIKLKKEWMATFDDRTRDSHADLDGERVDYNKAFSNGLMYPADPKGHPREVYNCRCTMRAILPDINDEDRETYDEWVERMRQNEVTLTDRERKKAGKILDGQREPQRPVSTAVKGDGVTAKKKVKVKEPEKTTEFIKKKPEEHDAKAKKSIPKTLESYNSYAEPISQARASELTEKEAAELKGMLEGLFKNNNYASRVSLVNLNSITDDGLKNQLETLSSGGTFAPSDRINASKKLFGIADTDKLSAGDFEKYGYLAPKNIFDDITGGEDLAAYGDTILTLKKSKVVASYTVGDSLQAITADKGIAGMASGNVNLAGIRQGEVRELYNAFKTVGDSDPTKLANEIGQRYVELQFHGEITADMVESITITKDKVGDLSDELVTKLKSKDINILCVDLDTKEITEL